MEPTPRTVPIGRVEDLVDRDLPPSRWLEVTQPRVDAFADTVDDRHWVHNDPVAAARGPFGGAIGHAHLTLALLPSFVRQVLTVDGGAGMFYGYNRVRFPSPVPVGGRIRMLGRVTRVEAVGGATQLTVQCVVEIEGAERPACAAEAVWRHYAAVEMPAPPG